MKNSYNALIVDDERLARQDLKDMLKECENIRVVGEADGVDSAIKAIDDLNPDVIFLDIQMPGESGFELLEKTKITSRIIFVTAYDEYAIRAFEVNALDYLLKPVSPDRLKRALERLDIDEESEVFKSKSLQNDDHLFLLFNNQFKFILVKMIVSIAAAGDYSELYLSDGHRGLVQKSMKEWEDRLPENFCRIHRSNIINLDYIDRLEEWFNYSYQVYLKGIKEPFVMSRRFAVKLKDKLK
ncbi:MAG: LytTR family DNA-binding domain-containing protein [Candidatus Neomarinimicrobiota bacterium]